MMETYQTTTTRLSLEGESCALVQDLLPLYLDGEVSAVSRDQIAAHLARCERCAGFMAGAQSVRVQLRRDQMQRTASIRADAPQRGVVLRTRDVVASMFAMLLCLPGGVAAFGIGEGLRGDSGAMAGGMFLSALVVGGLLGLARILGPLTSQRISALFGGVAFGGAGVILLFIFGASGGSPLGMLAGFVVGLAGLVGVWSGIARGGQWPLFQAP